MEVWNPTERDRVSHGVLLDADFGYEEYPKELDSKNNKDIIRFSHHVPGIFEIQGDDTGLRPMIIVGGIHGDEKAGITILDRIIGGLLSGEIRVRRNLLLMYGNLQAMKGNNFKGMRCIESEFGEVSNLNRCFGRDISWHNTICYAQRRAYEMMNAVEQFVSCYGVPDVIDIHQSFAVPTLEAVRGGAPDRSDYTYAVSYPIDNDHTSALSWFYESYSDIVAGVVLADMSKTQYTFAGYMASTFGSRAATFEQGTIGYIDYDSFVPQLTENLIRKIGGEEKIDSPEGFDVWRCLRGIIKTSKDFRFVDSSGCKQEAPCDFLPLHEGVIAHDGDVLYELGERERLLFANSDVPIGDRAAAVIERVKSDLIPTPR